MHADASAGGDENISVVERIGDFRKAPKGSWRRDIEVCGPFHGDRLVWSLGVEFLNEGIEFGLLLKAIHAGRACSFTFEG